TSYFSKYIRILRLRFNFICNTFNFIFPTRRRIHLYSPYQMTNTVQMLSLSYQSQKFATRLHYLNQEKTIAASLWFFLIPQNLCQNYSFLYIHFLVLTVRITLHLHQIYRERTV